MHRNHMAWFLVMGLACALAFSLACSEKKTVPAPTPAPTPTPAPPTNTGWTPEPPKAENLALTDADTYNKQGVLKRIHFETDKWDITPEARQLLKENAAWINAHPEFRLSVEGHCDERNTEAYNLALGERRANAAKEYLIGLGVPADKIQTVSYGKNRPLDGEHNEEAWAKNRRDEFILIDAKK